MMDAEYIAMRTAVSDAADGNVRNGLLDLDCFLTDLHEDGWTLARRNEDGQPGDAYMEHAEARR